MRYDRMTYLKMLCIILPMCFSAASNAERRLYERDADCISVEEFYETGRIDNRACHLAMELIFLRLAEYREGFHLVNGEKWVFDRDFLLDRLGRVGTLFIYVDEVFLNIHSERFTTALFNVDNALNALDSESSNWKSKDRRDVYLLFSGVVLRKIEAKFKSDKINNFKLGLIRQKLHFMQPDPVIAWEFHDDEVLFCIVKHDYLYQDFEFVRDSPVVQRCIDQGPVSRE